MNITTIIILYNSSIEESSTIQSLLTSNITNINLKVIIWNNGPKPLKIFLILIKFNFQYLKIFII